jgi:hypothetical protein
LLLPGASAGPLGPVGLTPTERSALHIVSVQAVGAEGSGMLVTVTFGGNLEKAIGRGNLKNALVAVILRPKDAQLATADLATDGAGPIGLTSKKTRSKSVGAVRNGRTFTFFIAGPGSSNVKDVVVKTFTSLPTRKTAAAAAGKDVPPDVWEKLEQVVAFDEKEAAALDATANGSSDCFDLKLMQLRAAKALARAEGRQSMLVDLRGEIDADIARVSKNVGGDVDFAEKLAHSIAAPLDLALRVLTGKSSSERFQHWRDLLRSLQLDRRLVSEYLARNQALIDSLNVLKGKLDGLYTARCGGVGTGPPAATFKVGVKPSYMHPEGGGSTSTLCVRVTTSPAKPGSGVTVKVTGPGVVGPAQQTTTLDASGQIVANVIINALGTYSVAATVSAGDETETATATQTVQKTQAKCPPP